MTIELELTRGQVAVIDDIDADLAEFKWCVQAHHSGDFYAVRNAAHPKRMKVLLHRVILERVIGRPLTKTELTDHVSGDKLDNRRTNLRIATNAQNLRNRGKQRNNTTGFKGVAWHRTSEKWTAQIVVNGKKMHLGYFTTPEAAHAAYCIAARELHGEFANIGVK